MNTKDVGDTTVAMVMAALIKIGKVVLLPFGDNRRYDLALDDNGKLCRIQCKTGKLERGQIGFRLYSSSVHRGGKRRHYHGEADYFGVYCPQNGKCYLVPVADLGIAEASLRVEPPKNNQTRLVRFAKDFEI